MWIDLNSGASSRPRGLLDLPAVRVVAVTRCRVGVVATPCRRCPTVARRKTTTLRTSPERNRKSMILF